MHSLCFVSMCFCLLIRSSGLEFYVAFVFCIAVLFASHRKKEPAQCRMIPLDGKQIIGRVEVHSESGQNHVTRQQIPVIHGTGDDDAYLVVAICCQLCYYYYVKTVSSVLIFSCCR